MSPRFEGMVMKKPLVKYGYRMTVDMGEYLRNLVLVAVIAMTVGAGLTLTITGAFFHSHDNRKDEIHESEIASYELQLDEADDRIVREVASAMSVKNVEIGSLKETIADLCGRLSDLQTRYDSMLYERTQNFNDLKRLWYVFRDTPTGSNVSADLLLFSIEQCQVWDVNPDLMWAIYSVESVLNTYAHNESGATGLGQVIPSTGRAYWIDILGHDYFDASMLYDPYVNVEITTALVGRNLKNGLYACLDGYSGGGGQSYVNAVNQVLSQRGLTVGDWNCHYC